MYDLPHPSGAALSTRTLLPFGTTFTARVADLCRCDSLDIDLARPLPGATSVARRLEFTSARAAVVWLPSDLASTPDLVVESPIVSRWLPDAPVLVVDLPRHPDELMQTIGRAYQLAERLAPGFPECAVAVGLRSNHLAGGRHHLANLTLLRRRTEEWGLSIALDLTATFDPMWEAEAAVLRLGSRLTVLRVRSRAHLPSAVDADRVARRAVRAAVEQRRDVRLSIEPDVHWWQRRNGRAVAEAWTAAANRCRPRAGFVAPGTAPSSEERRRHRSLPPR